MDGRSGDGWMLMECLRENKQDGWMYRRMNAINKTDGSMGGWMYMPSLRDDMDVWPDGGTYQLKRE